MKRSRTRIVAVLGVSLVALLSFGVPAANARSARVPVLGAAAFALPSGVGWGTYKPPEIFNGGDPSGMVSGIHWKDWGKKVAIGIGKTSIFMPGGGYYPGLVPADLRASDLGHCTAGGPLAYEHLSVREPTKPGGSLGPSSSWSESKTLCKFGA